MNQKKEMSREEFLYHNTEVLLKRYRDVVWSIEVSAMQAEFNFEIEMGCKLDEFLGMSYAAGGDLSGTKIQEQMRILERNKNMLKMIDAAVDMLRKRQRNGELYYWILYYTYLSDKPCKRVEETIQKVVDKTDFISEKTYFRCRKDAIEILSTILWGYSTRDCLPFLYTFGEKNEKTLREKEAEKTER